MKRPRGLRGLAGTPIVTLAVLAAGGWCLYQWFLNQDAMAVGLVGLFAICWTMAANSDVAQYTAWKRAWDSMAPGGSPDGAMDHPAAKIGILVLVATGLGVYLDANRDQADHELALDWLVGSGFVLLVVALAVLRFRSTARPFWARRRRAGRSDAVSICVRRPLMRVPDLTGAYEALPPHCWTVMNAR